MRNANISRLVALAGTAFFAASAGARPDAFWANPVNGSWTAGANWLGGVVPNNSTFDVYLNAAGALHTVTLTSQNYTLNSLLVAGVDCRFNITSATLRVNNGLSIDAGYLGQGSPNFDGSTIIGTTITSTNGGRFQMGYGCVLDAVVLNTDAEVVGQGQLSIKNNLALAPGRTLTIKAPTILATSVRFSPGPAQSMSGTVIFDGAADDTAINVDWSNPLTIQAGALVRTGTAGANMGIGSVALTNLGTISSETAGRRITLRASNLVNQGLLRAANGGRLVLDGSIAVGGLGNISAATGIIALNGTLNNAGNTILLDAPDEILTLDNGSTGSVVSGGTLATANGGRFQLGGGVPRFDAVTLDADLHVHAGRTLQARTSLTIAAGRTLTVGEFVVAGASSLVFQSNGINTISGPGAIRFEADPTMTSFATGHISAPAGSTLVLDTNLTVRSGTDAGIIGSVTTGLINHGTILSTVPGRRIIIRGQNWRNEGVINLDGGGLQLEGTMIPGGLGTVIGSGASSILVPAGQTFENTGNEIELGGDSPLRIHLRGTFRGGTIFINDTDPLRVGGERVIGTSTSCFITTKDPAKCRDCVAIGTSPSSGIAMDADDDRSMIPARVDDRAFISVDTGCTFTVENNLVLGGVTAVLANSSSNGGLIFSGTQSLLAERARVLGGGLTDFARGTVLCNGAGAIQNIRADAGTLTIGDGIKIITGDGSLRIGVQQGTIGAIVNEGLISSRTPGQFVELAGTTAVPPPPFVNQGTGILEAANGGTLHINATSGAIAFSNTGAIRAGVGGVVYVRSGGLTMTPTGTTWIEFGGRNAAQFGRFTVTGATAVNGVLKCQLETGFAPVWGDVWTVLTASTTASGAFSSLVGDPLPNPAWRWWSDLNGATVRVGVSHAADLNHDNSINTADLVAFLGQFGQSGSNFAADLNNDSAVNTADLVQFLGAFGLSAS